MKDCTTCEYDILDFVGKDFPLFRRTHCEQGHHRTIGGVIQDCHAWVEKNHCWCENTQTLTEWLGSLSPQHKYQIKYCPTCGKHLARKAEIFFSTI